MKKNGLKKIQELPIEKRKLIFSCIVISASVLLIGLWIVNLLHTIQKINLQDVKKEFDFQDEEFQKMRQKQEEYKTNLKTWNEGAEEIKEISEELEKNNDITSTIEMETSSEGLFLQ
ncbi:MAG TPA: hypothetical protein PKM84_01630 [Candidatus Pacearchaeota archaeon]|nr:hypothetical protein [Candidatus Pacearchaeota archaeon]